MIEDLLGWISTILYLILGGVSMSKKILKPKTQFYTSCISIAANLIWTYVEFMVGNYSYVFLGIVYSVMSLYCMIKFRRLWKNAD